jgi:hypothetical protein
MSWGRYSAAMSRVREFPGAIGEVLSKHRKSFHALTVLAVSLCLLSHMIEGLTGWDRNFLHTGRDTETVLFFVFLLLGLAFVLATLIFGFVPLLRRLESLVAALHVAIPVATFAPAIIPDTSPPIPLRI